MRKEKWFFEHEQNKNDENLTSIRNKQGGMSDGRYRL